KGSQVDGPTGDQTDG
ncbi:hypothetical protein BIW11_04842, partial [Tropilaelaps mercedesae]